MTTTDLTPIDEEILGLALAKTLSQWIPEMIELHQVQGDQIDQNQQLQYLQNL